MVESEEIDSPIERWENEGGATEGVLIPAGDEHASR